MIGVIIPAHNEQDHISQCVAACRNAAINPRLLGEAVEVLVVLDSCTDQTGALAVRHGAEVISVTGRNVGRARAAGAEYLIGRGARWLAFTDADTRVSADWLVEQLTLNADAVCGTVAVDDWRPHGEHAGILEVHFQRTYTDAENHRHIHGANLGVSAQAYERAGGFSQLACSEDVAFVQALEASGAHIAWSAKPRVITSARREARASGGFADALIRAVGIHLDAGGISAAAT